MSPDSNPGMIFERARVLRVAPDTAWVQCESQAGCVRCAAGEGCGAGLFAKLLRARLQELPVELPRGMTLAAGDPVLLGLPVSAVQNASFLLYGLPLAGLMLGAIGGALAVPGDAVALAGTLAGLVGGLAAARWSGRHLAARRSLEPILLRQLSAEEPCPAGREARQ